jgi:hypothetical protein
MTFNSANPGTLAAGTSSRIKPLAAPLTLVPGQYSIVSYGHNSNDLNDNVGTRGNKTWSADDGNGLLAFVGGGRYGGSVGQLPPSVDGGPADRYAAGTFEYSPLDNDGDGLPYDWETTYGLDPDNPADADRDNDGDGQSNRSEFYAGSNPSDRSSVLSLDLVSVQPEVVLRLPVFPNRTARVESSGDLATWNVVQTIAPSATLRTLDVIDPNSSSDARYYRVTAAPPP